MKEGGGLCEVFITSPLTEEGTEVRPHTQFCSGGLGFDPKYD